MGILRIDSGSDAIVAIAMVMMTTTIDEADTRKPICEMAAMVTKRALTTTSGEGHKTKCGESILEELGDLMRILEDFATSQLMRRRDEHSPIGRIAMLIHVSMMVGSVHLFAVAFVAILAEITRNTGSKRETMEAGVEISASCMAIGNILRLTMTARDSMPIGDISVIIEAIVNIERRILIARIIADPRKRRVTQN